MLFSTSAFDVYQLTLQSAERPRENHPRRSQSPTSSPAHDSTALPTRSHPSSHKPAPGPSKAKQMAVNVPRQTSSGAGRGDDGDDGDQSPMDEDDPDMDDDAAAMQAMMGFGGFGSTKGKKIAGNNAGSVHREKTTEYRQYMNRQGGFNRPLSPSR